MAGSRKNELRALFGGGLAPTEQPLAPEAKPEQQNEVKFSSPSEAVPPQRSASGAVKAMGLSLGAMTREAEEARALRQALNEGERVVAVHPDRIDSSIVEDRLRLDGRDDEDFAALVDSIREGGQQVPVLLRPHPDQSGRYQTAYGHRRVRAAARLGIEVKAIVRPLSDDELVLAQGKENAERRNLSFIERSVFAKNLASHGFDRKVIGDALAVQKSELSRLFAVVESIPDEFIRLIGPAPKVGRDRWMKLGELLQTAPAQQAAKEEVHYQRFQAADSDGRFQLLFDRLSRRQKPEASLPEEIKDANGKVFARLKLDGKNRRIEFAADVEAAFIEDTAALLAERYQAFVASRSGDKH
ncbi:plasmid partitioning protein RepB [Rhizobium deserti]|uniref:Plasmid partitioning protein RepB n=1 Tax=Rhizobium deserti TaxID=2547961 RepID=A0A4R5UB79_9HYPH|nr:plasmid partitioning protein RepB [Rhizobium deserti]TDK32308.1 plasmid partitioning protein RepB [Rhizobium deserti]